VVNVVIKLSVYRIRILTHAPILLPKMSSDWMSDEGVNVRAIIGKADGSDRGIS
jgi:hypothetical protein